ncbi:MAG: NfeD family protein [Bacilli bacterium]|nr:NfeD family protein [Bacilli bacterium]
MFYVWLAIAIILAILEMSTVSLVSIWYIISSIIAMLTSLFTDNVVIQVAIFVLAGTLLLILTKDAIKKILPEKTKTNIDRIIGMEGIVTEKITKKKPGEVKVDGKRWTAVADENIPEDSIVEILEINSTKLKVKRMEE